MSTARTHLLRSVVIAGGLLLTLPVMADAPLAQYDKFIENDTTIRDRMTKLRWDRRPLGPTTLAEAETQCAPRRVPNLKELLTLVDESPHEQYEGTANVPKAIDPSAFGDVNFTPTGNYWTSSRDRDASGPRAWVVSSTDGSILSDGVTTPNYVRCVTGPN